MEKSAEFPIRARLQRARVLRARVRRAKISKWIFALFFPNFGLTRAYRTRAQLAESTSGILYNNAVRYGVFSAEDLRVVFAGFNYPPCPTKKCDMFTTSTQTVGVGQQGQGAVPIRMSDHARDRWIKRTPADISLEAAWNQALDVEAPEADATAARLFPPYNALLLVKHANLTTVLYNHDHRLNTPGLTDCPRCGDLIDLVDYETCPWCGADCTRTARPGCVTITRGDI
jgi:hypothetical protein